MRLSFNIVGAAGKVGNGSGFLFRSQGNISFDVLNLGGIGILFRLQFNGGLLQLQQMVKLSFRIGSLGFQFTQAGLDGFQQFHGGLQLHFAGLELSDLALQLCFAGGSLGN